MKPRAAVLLLLLLLLFVAAVRAGGSTSNTGTVSTYFQIGTASNGIAYGRAQGFQISAGILTQFTFDLGANSGSPSGTMTWEIRNDSSGTPGTSVLATGTLTPTASATNTVNVSAGPTLSASTTYWLYLRPTSAQSTNVYWSANVTGSDHYPTYRLYSYFNSAWAAASINNDLLFSVTTTDPTPTATAAASATYTPTITPTPTNTPTPTLQFWIETTDEAGSAYRVERGFRLGQYPPILLSFGILVSLWLIWIFSRLSSGGK